MIGEEQPTIFGDGTQSRDFTYIDNVVSANFLACEAPGKKVAGETFNVATGRAIDLNTMFHALQEMTGFNSPPCYSPERSGDVKHSVADLAKVRAALAYEPVVGFEDGLRETVKWYRTTSTLMAYV
jgi:UDP-glucose 4-epimerase